MLEYIKNESNRTLTENDAVTYQSTGSDCLDLFATIGALRHASEKEIIRRFIRGYAENPDAAMKLLFFARDIRGGLGERRVFRLILRWIAKNKPESVRKNVEYVVEFGRYDDLLCLLGTNCEKDAISVLKSQFDADMEALENGGNISLLGKWLPSVNTSDQETVRKGKKVAKAFGMSEKEYRQALSRLRKKLHIIENNLRLRDYSFDYSKQPSRALFKYRAAFSRNDQKRYDRFLSKVSAGEEKLHASNVAPYELVNPYVFYTGWECGVRNIPPEESRVLNATWESLPDYGGNENALVVVDTSGSMYCRYGGPVYPISVALSLGLYFAERNRGMFHNYFIEFSESPELIEVKGKSFVDRLCYAASFCKAANTNIEAVFDLVLNAAVKNHANPEELPSKLVIISDMEFDECVHNASATNFENARNRFESCGYRLPDVVFWNVASRNRQQPVTMNEQGVALVSGVTPRLFSMIAGDALDPYAFMMDVLNNPRYEKISA